MREPDKKGPAGRAWVLARDKARTKDHEASLSGWLVNVPGVHPFWEYWGVGVIHLRDIPGVRPANKHYPGAEYEFMIYSINPEEGTPDPDKPPWGFLQPLDVQYQFDGLCDAEAVEICELAIEVLVRGGISPDQDFRQAWAVFIGGLVTKKLSASDGQHRGN